MWWPRMEAKTKAKLSCFFLFLALLAKLTYDGLIKEDEISSKIDEKDKWSWWITQGIWHFWIRQNKWTFWIKQAIPCLFSFCSFCCTTIHIAGRRLNHLRLQDKSTFFQLSIMLLTTFIETFSALTPTKQSKFLINWLRRSEVTCWSLSSIVAAYQEKNSIKKKLSMGERFIKLNCVEMFELTDHWIIVLLLVALIIGTIEYATAAIVILVYFRELMKINYTYIIKSPGETLGILGTLKKLLGILGRVGETLFKFILRSLPCSVVVLHTYSSEPFSFWFWAAAEVGDLVEILRKGRGILSYLIYSQNIDYSKPN